MLRIRRGVREADNRARIVDSARRAQPAPECPQPLQAIRRLPDETLKNFRTARISRAHHVARAVDGGAAAVRRGQTDLLTSAALAPNRDLIRTTLAAVHHHLAAGVDRNQRIRTRSRHLNNRKRGLRQREARTNQNQHGQNRNLFHIFHDDQSSSEERRY